MKLTREEAKLIKRHAKDATRLFACPRTGLPLLAPEDSDEVPCDCGRPNLALNDARRSDEVRQRMHYVRFLSLW